MFLEDMDDEFLQSKGERLPPNIDEVTYGCYNVF